MQHIPFMHFAEATSRRPDHKTEFAGPGKRTAALHGGHQPQFAATGPAATCNPRKSGARRGFPGGQNSALWRAVSGDDSRILRATRRLDENGQLDASATCCLVGI